MAVLVAAPGLARRAVLLSVLAAAGLGLALVAVFGVALSSTGVAATSCVAALVPPPPTGSGSAPQWTPEQRANAAAVVGVGQSLGVPARAEWIALATAMQESSLVNLPGGDRDSAGLFQQRPSQGWGSVEQVRDPRYAATQFYTRLLALPDWDQMPLTQAAQAVQRSAFPDAYAKWEQPAADLLSTVGAGGGDGLVCSGSSTSVGGDGGPALDFARAQLGKPYVWGATGPGSFDCSGLVLRAWEAAGVQLPRTSREQATAGQQIPRAQAQPGDLLFWSSNGQVSGVHHVALYLGDGQIIEAPTTGIPVRTRALGGSYDDRELLPFAIRPGATA
ncbi:C40 family peptidase [Pseudonocardia sp. D17]|uniref:C40 family peptidase n=1 Tax=Pseudonocardia sp. D17 TaxID=882661 RepID=UPI002B3796E9|nr:lipoprotein [Pseudonocardia sp. D17]